MGSARLTLCAGLLLAGAVAVALGPADGVRAAGRAGRDTVALPSVGAAGLPAPAGPRTAASASPSARPAADGPGAVEAVTGLLLAGAATAAVLLLPHRRGGATGRDRDRTED
ncbi:hypothetical protein M3765_16870 [Streptomyces thermoviolaceus]|uniref:Uncharacterized protein n=1 Tax=Streptomyces thermoviolaceus subsp. thermoviolaceus TaxID=66860 RepID=A0ABX0Z0M3_STRTL|nr:MULTISPECIES: hypothetical protein [Streptomyces]MCM3265669.1 hypothetical protein [Streptomyces thermoviolaceus]NJP16830.1 hypothetical protein [Streptomyces thermoviolaceus subsp. thermoviolaceus]RSS00769.1 hypothetical protein EF917_16685 [Streptomyces sp. WAC00469]GHB09749.1 hypothetical protein GCM10010512_46570 [Streptomyces thermoviolaceus subsp. thermoviolaceus]